MQPEGRHYRYFDLVMAGFVIVLVCSGVIGAPKISQLFGFTFGAAVVFFPFSYIFGDILTEVYGYARARRVVWAGFAGLGFASLMSAIVVAMPPAPGWNDQQAFVTVLGQTPRIALASLIAYWAGEFANSFVLAKIKVRMEGRVLWVRTIGSTIVGQAVDSLLFYPLAFWALWTPAQVFEVMIVNYFLKVGVEALMTPVTYIAVRFLKRVENEDYYDRDTRFTPFSLEE
ncbi:MAG: queuosine precursor transporter [Leptospirales bacterium]|nr:queuosine precursor transporter [Leptospirales bacterium]